MVRSFGITNFMFPEDEVQIGILIRYPDSSTQSWITGLSGESPFTVHQQFSTMQRFLSLGQKKRTSAHVIQPVQWGFFFSFFFRKGVEGCYKFLEEWR